MKITILFTEKSEKGFVTEAVRLYEKRIRHYIPLEIININSPVKGGNSQTQKVREGEAILSKLPADGFIILLDERGEDMTSVQFAETIHSAIHQNIRKLFFIFGGPYGVTDEVRVAANRVIRLSSMTFSHQVVRILFMEQLYRAFTIIRREPYHHE